LNIGFLLFDDWDSNKAQRHYSQKQQRLLDFNVFTTTTHLPNLDYGALETEWKNLINSIDFDLFTQKRNPIKHTHSSKHDGVKKSVVTQSPHMNASEFSALVEGTSHALTEAECRTFLNDANNFIDKIHKFLNDHKLMLRIYCDNINEDKIQTRRSLLNIFLTHPYAYDLFSSEFTLSVP
jgi:hypothetical protein